MIELSQIPVGDACVWDFGFKYNLHVMDLQELEVIMIKFEVELKRSIQGGDRYWEITAILGKIYREIMRRKVLNHIQHIEEHKKII